MIKKSDSYAKHLDVECRFWKISDDRYSLQTSLDEKNIKKGFLLYEREDLKHKMYKHVSKVEIQSAFYLRVFCTYREGKYDISNIFENMAILSPDLDTKRLLGFHIYDDRRIHLEYEKFIRDVSEIWEEREPIEGFIFDVDPIHYIKKK